MKLSFNINRLYSMILIMLLTILIPELSAQGLRQPTEPHVFKIGWEKGKYAPTAWGIERALVDAMIRQQQYPDRFITVEFAPGKYDLGNDYIKLRDSVVFKFGEKTVITGTHAKGLFYDDSVNVKSFWEGEPVLQYFPDSPSVRLKHASSSIESLIGLDGKIPESKLNVSIPVINDTGYVKTTGDTLTGDYFWLGAGNSSAFSLRSHYDFGGYSNLRFFTYEDPQDEFPRYSEFHVDALSGIYMYTTNESESFIELSYSGLYMDAQEIYIGGSRYYRNYPTRAYRLQSSGTNFSASVLREDNNSPQLFFERNGAGDYRIRMPDGTSPNWIGGNYIITYSLGEVGFNQHVKVTISDLQIQIKTYNVTAAGGTLAGSLEDNILKDFYIKIEKPN